MKNNIVIDYDEKYDILYIGESTSKALYGESSDKVTYYESIYDSDSHVYGIELSDVSDIDDIRIQELLTWIRNIN